MPKVGLVSLGCPKNLVDSEVMLGQLAARGWELVSAPEDADVIIVNTCSFIEPAKQESIDTILEMAGHKTRSRARRLVVAGCLVERYRQEILKEIPEVDFVIGTNELERVTEACDLRDGSPAGPKSRNADRSSSRPFDPYLYTEFTPRVLSTPSYSAYLKIAEGCDHPCSFCVIPQMRGKFRSRRFESVVREAENLARQGVRELVLVGQDTTSYGADLGLHDGLSLLIEELARIPELVWIRFLYCYPNRLTDRLVEAVAGSPKIARYFDIPLQHASRAVLKGMRRGSDGAQFLKVLGKIRAAIPGVTLRTTMIVGFPGETDEDFRALCDFVEEAEFDHLGVFTYSNEESSAAFSLPGSVAKGVAEKRRRKILSLQRRVSRKKLRDRVGQRLPLLVEGRAEETDLLFTGRLESQAPEIDGRVLINDFEGPEPVVGEFRWARITEAADYDLVARLEAERFGELRPSAVMTRPEATASKEPRLVQIQPAAGVPEAAVASALASTGRL
jgi:ribosomal protein S12 methylthiotransferase